MRSPIATAYDYASLPEWMSPRRCVLLEVNGDVAGTKTKAPVAASSAKQTTPTKSSTTTTKARNAKTESIANTTMHAEMTDYEREREERIAENKRRLEAVKAAAKELQRVASAPLMAKTPMPKNGRKKKREAPAEATRKSARTRGTRASYSELGDDEGAGSQRHMTCDEYCEENGLEPGPLMTGFHGWIEESVRRQLGIEENAEDAWIKNGGGKFDRKPAKGESAREYAQRMLFKNPNAYFYRHLNPGSGEVQNTGDWSEAEIKLFVKVAKEHGCGDKWGLFASYIPNRVGYQCSACYRHNILPRGLLRDNNWLLTPSGEAHWNGTKGGS